jgi:RimJ/RimL family protein N-acetyltransferase
MIAGKNSTPYIFTSQRLGFRSWRADDALKMAALNADPEVMEFFPKLSSETETQAFIERMQKQFIQKGFCYFAVDELENGEFIGFIGISEQTYEADYTPCVDIGWRLDKKKWGKGYATEGAKRCLEFAFDQMKLETIKSVAPVVNIKSQRVMQKIGMKKVKNFHHPLLAEDARLQECVLYEIVPGDLRK